MGIAILCVKISNNDAYKDACQHKIEFRLTNVGRNSITVLCFESGMYV